MSEYTPPEGAFPAHAPALELNSIVLERLKVVAGSRVGRAVMESLDVREAVDYLTDSMMFQLRAYLLGHKLAEKRVQLVVDYPATPWDHWKERYLPKLGRLGNWYLDRHPVRMSCEVRSYDFTEHATFPESTMRYPEHLGAVHIMQQVHADPWAPLPPHRRIWPSDEAILEDLIGALVEAGYEPPPGRADWPAVVSHIRDGDVHREVVKRITDQEKRRRDA